MPEVGIVNMGGGVSCQLEERKNVDRYLLLVNAYQSRDKVTMIIFLVSAVSVLAWSALDILPEPFKSMRPTLVRVYSASLLLAYIVILVACFILQGRI